MPLLFKLIPICYQNAENHDSDEVEFLLEYDNWNDYGYHTTYHLHASRRLSGGKAVYLGSIHIMHYGQTETEGSLGIFGFKVGTVFEQLPEEVVSISFSQDLYRGVKKYLPTQEQRISFVKALRLLFDTKDSRYERLKKDKCFEKSVLRNATMDSFALRKGRQYMLDEAVFYDLEKKTLSVKFTRADDSIPLNFDTPVVGNGDEGLPYGMIAFIGQNGSGKSTLLYQLARCLYASPNNRFLLKDISVSPSDVGASKLLMFSYSAFDNFLFPGITLSDYRLMAEGVANRQGRFIYCGVRDVKQEMEKYINNIVKKKEQKEASENIKEENDDLIIVQEERINEIVLKPVSTLAEELLSALQVINSVEDTRAQWMTMGERCRELLPTLYEDISKFVTHHFLWYDLSVDDYMNLSTGVKFFLHIMSQIYAYVEDNSILLFDEPENHLHPPMLSFMMNEIRKAIRQSHSVMLVATHSPVIIQEMFAHNVYVVNRVEDKLIFKQPVTETYGENFGYINNMVFHLNSDITNFHEVFNVLYDKWNCQEILEPEKVIKKFEEQLGCQSLSSQMVAYLVNLHLNKRES